MMPEYSKDGRTVFLSAAEQRLVHGINRGNENRRGNIAAVHFDGPALGIMLQGYRGVGGDVNPTQRHPWFERGE